MRQNEKQKKSNSKLLNVVGRKLRALHTAKCRFVSWFTILGHRMARPTGWMERDQEFFFFIVSIQLHSLHKAFVHLCYVVVIPISHKQRRLRGFYTPDAFFFFFFFSPNPRRPLEIQLADWAMGEFPSGAKVELDFELLLSFQMEQQQLQKCLKASHQCTEMSGFKSLF